MAKGQREKGRMNKGEKEERWEGAVTRLKEVDKRNGEQNIDGRKDAEKTIVKICQLSSDSTRLDSLPNRLPMCVHLRLTVSTIDVDMLNFIIYQRYEEHIYIRLYRLFFHIHLHPNLLMEQLPFAIDRVD